MHDNFEDLMYQAGLTAQGSWDEMDRYDRVAIMKFAELIVRSCAGVAHGSDTPSKDIKDYFGLVDD